MICATLTCANLIMGYMTPFHILFSNYFSTIEECVFPVYVSRESRWDTLRLFKSIIQIINTFIGLILYKLLSKQYDK